MTFGTMLAKSDNIRNTTDTQDGLDYHNRMAFSTHDRDQDKDETRNCAATFGGGGWWYKSCYHLNLNGNKTTSDKKNLKQMTRNRGDEMISSSEMKMFRVH